MRIVSGWVGQVNSISEGKPCFSGAEESFKGNELPGFYPSILWVIARFEVGAAIAADRGRWLTREVLVDAGNFARFIGGIG